VALFGASVIQPLGCRTLRGSRMRLLEIVGDSLRLNNFQGNVPSYAILSHTWGPNGTEITFEDLKDGLGQDQAGLKKAGYDKLVFCGNQAKRDGLQYFWVDTCCIDKTNQAELTESIATMFQWYHDAARCYVYLSDVSFDQEGDDYNQHIWEPEFRGSRWFTRGWTLQELLAPKSVEFFSVQRSRLGDKQSLENEIHEITRIPIEALHGDPLHQFSIEERMEWAEGRITTRKEDIAYCLQGIFGVFLSPIYGEGNHASDRLKQAIKYHLESKSLSYVEMFGKSSQLRVTLRRWEGGTCQKAKKDRIARSRS
jgi:Heterokaryon incompatibility protein (HET)